MGSASDLCIFRFGRCQRCRMQKKRENTMTSVDEQEEGKYLQVESNFRAEAIEKHREAAVGQSMR